MRQVHAIHRVRKFHKLVSAVALAAPVIYAAHAPSIASAQMVYEPFDYGAGSVGTAVDNLTGTPTFSGYTNPMTGTTWFQASTTLLGATATSLSITSGNLSLAGRPASTGNSGGKTDFQTQPTARIGIVPGGSTQASGTRYYYSFLLNIPDTSSLRPGTDATGVILAAFNNSVGTQAALPGVLGTRLQIRQDAGDSTKFNLGVRSNTGTQAVNWGTTPTALAAGTTHFVVGAYEAGPSTADDPQMIWIDPSTSDYGAATAPTPYASVTGVGGTDVAVLSFVWRNFWQTPSMVGQLGPFQIDDLRIDQNWGQVTAPSGTSWAGGSGAWSSSLPDGANNFVNLNPGGGNVTVDAGGKTVGTITIRSSSSYTISGPGNLTMSAGAGSTPLSAINVQAEMNGVNATPQPGNHLISTNIALQNPLATNIATSQVLTLSGVMSGTSGITKSGAGELRLTGANTFDAGTNPGITMNGGTVTVTSDAGLGAVPAAPQTNIQNFRATLRLDGSFATDVNRGINLAAAGAGFSSAIDVTAGNTATFPGVVSGANLVKAGLGTLVLTGTSNTYTNNNLNAGVLSVSTNTNLGTVGSPFTFAGGTIRFTGSFSQGHNISIASAQTGTVDVEGANSVTFNGNLTSSGTLTKIGSGTMAFSLGFVSTNSSNSSLFNINNGVVQLIATPNALDKPTVSINVNNGLDLNGTAATIGGLSGNGAIALSATPSIGNNGLNTTFGGATSGTGGLTKIGSGTLTLTGTQGYTGATTVTLGKLVVATNLTTTSSVAVTDSMELAAGGGSNRVLRSGNLTFSGTGKLNLQDNKAILTAMSVGTFDGTSYTGVTGLVDSGKGGSNLWDGPTGIITTQSGAVGSNFTSIGVAKASDVRPNTATATATWAGQTITGSDVLVMYTYGGDANLDGKINVDDYIKIDSGIAAGLTGWSNGDFNYDGKVNIDDYTTVIDANIGNQNGIFPTSGSIEGGGSGAGVAAVPEPASFGLLGLGALGWMTRRRRAVRTNT